MGVLLVPDGHGNTVARGVGKREQEGLSWLKPDGIPIVLVIPHVDRTTNHISRVHFLAGRVGIVRFYFADDVDATRFAHPHHRFIQGGLGHHRLKGCQKEKGNDCLAHES